MRSVSCLARLATPLTSCPRPKQTGTKPPRKPIFKTRQTRRGDRFAYDSYRRLLDMFGDVVLGIPHEGEAYFLLLILVVVVCVWGGGGGGGGGRAWRRRPAADPLPAPLATPSPQHHHLHHYQHPTHDTGALPPVTSSYPPKGPGLLVPPPPALASTSSCRSAPLSCTSNCKPRASLRAWISLSNSGGG